MGRRVSDLPDVNRRIRGLRREDLVVPVVRAAEPDAVRGSHHRRRSRRPSFRARRRARRRRSDRVSVETSRVTIVLTKSSAPGPSSETLRGIEKSISADTTRAVLLGRVRHDERRVIAEQVYPLVGHPRELPVERRLLAQRCLLPGCDGCTLTSMAVQSTGAVIDRLGRPRIEARVGPADARRLDAGRRTPPDRGPQGRQVSDLVVFHRDRSRGSAWTTVTRALVEGLFPPARPGPVRPGRRAAHDARRGHRRTARRSLPRATGRRTRRWATPTT